jgi:hypothetical protein
MLVFLLEEQFGVAIALRGLLEFFFSYSPHTESGQALPMPEMRLGSLWEREMNFEQL